MLIWEVLDGNNQTKRVGFFRQNDTIGEGFSMSEQFDCYGEIIFSGVLEDISSGVNGISVCNSSMIITPLSWNASSNCGPLTIACKPSDQEPEITMNVTYQVAGKSMYSGISLLRTPLRPHEVSRLEKCPYLRDCFIHFSMWDKQVMS